MKIEQEIAQSHFDSEYEKLVVNLLFTCSWLNGTNNRRLNKFGISPQQYNVLRILRGQYPSPANVSTLRDRMLDRESNASRLVEKLRRKGLARRSECSQDRRAVDVEITEKGLQLLKEIDESAGEWMKQFHTLDQTEARTLNGLLDKLRG